MPQLGDIEPFISRVVASYFSLCKKQLKEREEQEDCSHISHVALLRLQYCPHLRAHTCYLEKTINCSIFFSSTVFFLLVVLIVAFDKMLFDAV